MEMIGVATQVIPAVDYPPVIKGSLRVILQIKDAFLTCLNMVEEYRNQLLSCKRGFAHDLVLHQLTQGVTAIRRLREDLAEIENRSKSRYYRNVALRKYLLERYPNKGTVMAGVSGIVSRIGQDMEDGSSQSAVSSILPPLVHAPESIEAALHGGIDQRFDEIDVDVIQVPEEINLSTSITEDGSPLLPVVEFYRGFYFLQMHFQIIMCQAVNFAMPVVTRQMSVSERAFSWPAMPNFGLETNSGTMKGRLLEIYTDIVHLAERLYDCLELVSAKLDQDKNIESYFIQHTASQEKVRNKLLRCLQAQRLYIDCLEGQNDKLTGLAVKLDPNFAKTANFLALTGPSDQFAPIATEGENQNSIMDPSVLLVRNELHSANDATTARKGSRLDDATVNKDFFEKHTFLDNKRIRQSKANKYKYEQELNNGKYSLNQYQESIASTTLNSDVEAQFSNVNGSASGGGETSVRWRKKLGSINSVRDQSTAGHALVFDVNRKVDSIRGTSKMADDLLLGLDSVAVGHGMTDIFPTSSKVTSSILDEYMKPATKISQTTAMPQVKKDNYDSSFSNSQSQTQSTLFSQVELISPTISIEQKPVTVLKRHSTENLSTFPTEVLGFKKQAEGSSDDQLDVKTNSYDSQSKHIHEQLKSRSVKATTHQVDRADQFVASDDTVLASNTFGRNQQYQPQRKNSYSTTETPKPLDTNVNASGTFLPEIVNKSGGIITLTNVPKETSYHNRRYSNANTMHTRKKQAYIKEPEENTKLKVLQVASIECGSFCFPDWVNRKCSNKSTDDDLLSEPKRSAINRALIDHRCRLVETILQADQEKLEELIILLTEK